MSDQRLDNPPPSSEPPVPPEPRVPPESPETPGHIAGQALVFLGPIMTFGGLIAIIRTGEKSLFYAAMLPLGLALWGLGFYLLRRRQ